MDAALVEFLEENGYTNIRVIAGKYCGLCRFIYTTGLVVGLNAAGYERRYCYENFADAASALAEWTGVNHPSGPWIKRKGEGGDLLNPNLEC